MSALPGRGTLLQRLAGSLSPNNLPWLLNPQRFPLRFPLNYLAFVSLPVLLPGLLGLILLKLRSSTKKSDVRVAEYERLWAIEHQHLQGESESESEGKSDKKNVEQSRIEQSRIGRLRLRLLVRAEDEAEELVRQVGEENVQQTPHPHLEASGSGSGSAGGEGDGAHQHQHQHHDYTRHSGRNTATAALSAEARSEQAYEYHLVPNETPLSAAQMRIARRLNALPQLRKHLAHIPDIVNTHAVIIVRSPKIEAHKRGAGVIQALAERFAV